MLEDDFSLLKKAGFKVKKNKVLKDLGLKTDYLKELSNY